ncbi:MAG: serine protease [Reyranella sp.]|uniref:S1 family peptidase n=1 Tax=Reyranella sp. TaxID=1929291 RepID=UPI001227A02C|nr:serine protease [Reyranella sp.]TAJ97134.1 MAG: serine protease [Reyranella sp.]
MDYWDRAHTADRIVRWVVGLSIIAMLMAALTSSSSPTPEQRAAASTVYVAINDEGSHGSGVVIAPGVVLTNHHVVEKLDKVSVEFPNGDKREAKVAWKGVNSYDLAVLLVDTKDIKPAAIDCAVSPVGRQVYAHGHPMSLRSITTWGKVASAPIYGDKEIADAVVLDLTITSGNSGGGVWSGGKLVGISTAVLAKGSFFGPPAQTGHSVMIPGSAICRVLGRS